MIIRPLNRQTDMDGLRDCLIELQDFEREIDPRMPPGKEIADDYIFEMLEDCETCDGAIIVADDIARAKKVRWLRISVLAANHVARRLYTELGYKELHLDLEKDFRAEE